MRTMRDGLMSMGGLRIMSSDGGRTLKHMYIHTNDALLVMATVSAHYSSSL